MKLRSSLFFSNSLIDPQRRLMISVSFGSYASAAGDDNVTTRTGNI